MRNAIPIIEKLIDDEFNVNIDISPRWHIESKRYKPYARIRIGKGLRIFTWAESFEIAEAIRQVSEEARKIYEGWR